MLCVARDIVTDWELTAGRLRLPTRGGSLEAVGYEAEPRNQHNKLIRVRFKVSNSGRQATTVSVVVELGT